MINVNRGDRLILRVCPLPIVDLSYRFLYSFHIPVDTVWRKGFIRFDPTKPDATAEDQLKTFCITQIEKDLGPEIFQQPGMEWLRDALMIGEPIIEFYEITKVKS